MAQTTLKLTTDTEGAADPDAVRVLVVTDRLVTVRWIVPVLEQLQAIVGGYIQAIAPTAESSAPGWHAYLNEEGKQLGLPRNEVACRLAFIAGWRHLPGDVLTGPVVFLGDAPDDYAEFDQEFGVPDALLALGPQVGLWIT